MRTNLYILAISVVVFAVFAWGMNSINIASWDLTPRCFCGTLMGMPILIVLIIEADYANKKNKPKIKE